MTTADCCSTCIHEALMAGHAAATPPPGPLSPNRPPTGRRSPTHTPRSGSPPASNAGAPRLPAGVDPASPRPYAPTVAELEDDGLRALIEAATANTVAHPARRHVRPVERLLPVEAER